MRALFIKEFRQGQPLLVFAVALGLLVIAAYAALGRFYLLYGQLEPEVLSFAFGIVAAALLPLLALFASSGVLAGEAHADTLPVLFGLPLSRLRIWGVLALSALALLVVGSAVVLAVTRVALHSPILSLALQAHLPDAVCFALFALSVGLFCSSLARGVMAALAGSVLLAGVIAGGASALVFYYGAPLTGMPILDLALWCLLSSPALLLGSAWAVTRGELMTGYRKWLYSVPLTLVALALTLALVCGLARALTPYRRDKVAVVATSGTWNGTKLLPLITAGGGVTVSRARGELLGERMQSSSTLGEALKQLSRGFHSYTRNYGVALDLETGKETLLQRAPLLSPSNAGLSMGCSADGRWVATLAPRQGLTWGRNEGAPVELCIYDTKTNKLVARSRPDLLDWSSWQAELAWSPSAKYLAIMRLSQSGGIAAKQTIRVVGRDAAPLSKAPIMLRGASWSPVEDVFYGFNANDALCRISPDGREKTVIWSPPPSLLEVSRWSGADRISPDGRWVVLSEWTELPSEPAQGQTRGRTEVAVRLVSIQSGESRMLLRSNGDQYGASDFAWSRDGRTLHALTSYTDKHSFWRTYTRRYQVMRWREGEEGLTPLGPAVTTTNARLMVPPGADGPLLWTWRQELPEPYSYEPPRIVAEELLAISADGRRRRLPILETSKALGWMGRELGFDSRGRLIYLSGQEPGPEWMETSVFYTEVAALDLRTGKTETIYP